MASARATSQDRRGRMPVHGSRADPGGAVADARPHRASSSEGWSLPARHTRAPSVKKKLVRAALILGALLAAAASE